MKIERILFIGLGLIAITWSCILTVIQDYLSAAFSAGTAYISATIAEMIS